jgi:hypothetical protein
VPEQAAGTTWESRVFASRHRSSNRHSLLTNQTFDKIEVRE